MPKRIKQLEAELAKAQRQIGTLIKTGGQIVAVIKGPAYPYTVTVEATLTQIDRLTQIDGVRSIMLERGPRLKEGK